MSKHTATPITEVTEEGLWEHHNLIWRYLETSMELCGVLASGSAKKPAILTTIGSLQPTPKFAGLDREYYWFGRAHIETEQPEEVTNPYRYNLHYQWVEIANRFHKLLNDLKPNVPKNFDMAAAADIAVVYEDEFAQFQQGELKEEARAACDLLSADKYGTVPELSPAGTAPTAMRASQQETIEVPIVMLSPNSAAITWKGKTHPVDLATGEAFEAMIDAKGQPVGIRKIVGKARQWLDRLGRDFPDLAAIVARASGNQGYRVTIFDPPSDTA